MERTFPATDLAVTLRSLTNTLPGARLTRNDVGNPAILDSGGHFVGWIDLVDPKQSVLNLEDLEA